MNPEEFGVNDAKLSVVLANRPSSGKWVGYGILLGLMILSIGATLAGFRQIAMVQSRKDFVEETHKRAAELDRWILQSQIIGMVRSLGISSFAMSEVVQGGAIDSPELVEQLERVRQFASAAVVYVMDATGTVVASTPYGEKKEILTGKNYSFRPYFTEALQGRDVVYPGVGVTTNQRGLYYSAPVYCVCKQCTDECEADCTSRIRGVVVIKMGLEAVDEFLEQYPDPVALISSQGVVFASNRLEWMYGSAYPEDASFASPVSTIPQPGLSVSDSPAVPLPVNLAEQTVRLNQRHYAVEQSELALHDSVGNWKLICLADQSRWVPLSQTASIVITLTILYGLGIVLFLVRRRQKAASLAAIESDRKLRTLMNNLPGMAYRCRNDRDWTMEFLSEGCRELTGHSPRELVENSVLSYNDLIHPEDREMVWATVQRAVEEERPYQMEYRLRNSQGRDIWVWEQGVGVFRNGYLEALEGLIIDITARKLAEQAQQIGKEKLAQIIMGSPVAAFVIDEQHFVTHWNHACYTSDGHSRRTRHRDP